MIISILRLLCYLKISINPISLKILKMPQIRSSTNLNARMIGKNIRYNNNFNIFHFSKILLYFLISPPGISEKIIEISMLDFLKSSDDLIQKHNFEMKENFAAVKHILYWKQTIFMALRFRIRPILRFDLYLR